jgi:hypothetical protein
MAAISPADRSVNGVNAPDLRYNLITMYIKVPAVDLGFSMPLLWVPPGIRFNDGVFTEPVRLAEWKPPQCAGLFVLLAPDLRWSPKPFQPLYFGEFGNNDPGAPTLQDGWAAAGNTDALFVAALALPYSTTAQRCALRNELVQAYNPVSQTEGARTSTRELARKLDAIEVRQHEQNTQIIALLQRLNQIFAPQPVPLRRPIGFVARTETNSAGY